MRTFRLAALPLAVLLLLQPLSPAPARADEETDESKAGVVLMVLCGLSLKATLRAPVPWAGVAAVSCIMGLIDAAITPDNTAPNEPPAKP